LAKRRLPGPVSSAGNAASGPRYRSGRRRQSTTCTGIIFNEKRASGKCGMPCTKRYMLSRHRYASFLNVAAYRVGLAPISQYLFDCGSNVRRAPWGASDDPAASWTVLNVKCWHAARPWCRRGELLKVVTGGTEGRKATPSPAPARTCALLPISFAETFLTHVAAAPGEGQFALAHPVFGTLHLRALTDCAIPRGCPLRSSVKGRQLWPAAILYPGHTAVVKREPLDH
jgi:hypothetical protein